MSEQNKFDPEKTKALIRQRGRTREWLAKQVGISSSYFSQVLCGWREPSLRVVKLLAQKLEVSEEDLLEHKGKAS